MKLAETYKAMDPNHVLKAFKDNVAVSFLDTADWSPLQAFDARMSTIEGMLNVYAGPMNQN
jgi:hypothetical protein